MADNEIHGKIKSYFTTAANRDNLTSGEELPTSLGKIKKWFSDLKNVAFTGSYNDLTNKPTIPSTVSITGAVEGSGSFTNGTASIAANRRACNIGNTTATAAPDTPWYLFARYTIPDSNTEFKRITFLVQTGFSNTQDTMNTTGILDVVARVRTETLLRMNWILAGAKVVTDDFAAVYNATTREVSLYAKIVSSYSTYRFVVIAESSNYNNRDTAELWTLYNTRKGDAENIAALPTGENITTAYSELANVETGGVNVISPAIDRTELAPSAERTGRSVVFRDKNNKQIGIIAPSRLTDGRERLYIAVNSENNGSLTTNYLMLDIATDGTCSYRVADKKAFREAIDADYADKIDQILDYGGYNKLPLDSVTSDSGITYTVDKKNGTITVTEVVTTGTPQIKIDFPAGLSGNYYFSALTSTDSDSTYDAYVWCVTDNARPKKWDGTTNSTGDYGNGDCEIQLDANKSYGMRIRFRRSMTGNFVFKPMIYSEYLKGIPFQPYAMTNVELTQNKVSTSGDTMTGDLFLKSLNIDRNTNPTSTITGTMLTLVDKDEDRIGRLAITRTADGTQRLYLSLYNDNSGTEASNYIRLDLLSDGTASYYVSNKEAFRTAIDCPQNKQLTNENLNNVNVPGFYNATSNNTCTNVPVAGSFGLLVVHTASGNYCKQYFFPINATAKPYFRSGNNGTWTDWMQISDISTTFYGTCSTAADSKNKEVTLSNPIGWQLTEGVVVGVKFTNSNTYTNATDSPITLNVEGTGAKNIWYGSTHSGAGNTGTSTSIYGYAGRITYYMYDGTYWVWMGMSYLDGNTVPSAYCNTSASTAAKTASCTGYSLLTNSYIHVLISNSNSAKSALTLSINSKTAKAIYINGTASSSSNYTLPAGTYLVFYDGTNYYFRTDGKITGTSIVDTSNNDIIANLQAENTILRNALSQSTFFIPEGTMMVDYITITDRTKCFYYIPDSATSIENSAFGDCKNLISITIPSSVTTIYNGAFHHCTSLADVTISNGVANIGGQAFWNCLSLTSITIPSSVINIDNNVFQGCTSLTSIKVNKSQGSISGAPWGAPNATVTWMG